MKETRKWENTVETDGGFFIFDLSPLAVRSLLKLILFRSFVSSLRSALKLDVKRKRRWERESADFLNDIVIEVLRREFLKIFKYSHDKNLTQNSQTPFKLPQNIFPLNFRCTIKNIHTVLKTFILHNAHSPLVPLSREPS